MGILDRMTPVSYLEGQGEFDENEARKALQRLNGAQSAPQTATTTSAPRVAGIRHGGSAPIERVDQSQVQPRIAANVAMDMGGGRYGLQEGVKPNLGADGRPTGMVGNQKIVRYDDLPSTQMMRAMTNRPTDFRGAAQRNSGMWNDPMINRLEQIQQKAQAAREQREKNRKVEQGVAEQGIARAYGMAIDAWRNAELRHGLEADKKTETANRYRVGAVEPQTLRELNAMIAPIVGMRNGEKIVGIYAASSVDANGTDRGQPTVFVRWRRPDGTIKQEPISYREAAQYVRKTMGNPGDRETDRNFVLQYGNTWRNAAGDGDELGLSKTADYMEWKQKQDAAKATTDATNLKNRALQQQIEQGGTTFEEERMNKPYSDAMAHAASLRKQAGELSKNNPDAAARLLKQAEDEESAVVFRRLVDTTREGETPTLPNGQPMTGWVKKDGTLVKVEQAAPPKAKTRNRTANVPPQTGVQQPAQGENASAQTPAPSNSASGAETGNGAVEGAPSADKDERSAEMRQRYTDVFDEVRKRAEDGARRSVEFDKKAGVNNPSRYDDAYREIFARLAKDKIESLSPQDLERLEKVSPGEALSDRINLRQSIYDLYGIDIYDKTGLGGALTGNGGTSNRHWYEDLVDRNGTTKKGSWRRGGKLNSDYGAAISVGRARAKKRQ